MNEIWLVYEFCQIGLSYGSLRIKIRPFEILRSNSDISVFSQRGDHIPREAKANENMRRSSFIFVKLDFNNGSAHGNSY